MQGKIIKSIAGFYEVHTGTDIYRCRAKGAFRALGMKPLVGDNVLIEVTDTVSVPMEGSIRTILPRSNALIRPNVANIDQALLLFAIKRPAPSYNMLDRFLITMSQKNLPAILCFNKQDLADASEKQELKEVYEGCGCKVLFISALDENSLPLVQELLAGKTTVITGPSGAGKSSLINQLCPMADMETGELSRKIERGKNTTRHVELFSVSADTYLMDTPGFTSLYLEDTRADDLKDYYEEFTPYAGKCRFNGCVHVKEPDCAVRAAVESGELSHIRYDNYVSLYSELKDQKPVYGKNKPHMGKY